MYILAGIILYNIYMSSSISVMVTPSSRVRCCTIFIRGFQHGRGATGWTKIMIKKNGLWMFSYSSSSSSSRCTSMWKQSNYLTGSPARQDSVYQGIYVCAWYVKGRMWTFFSIEHWKGYEYNDSFVVTRTTPASCPVVCVNGIKWILNKYPRLWAEQTSRHQARISQAVEPTDYFSCVGRCSGAFDLFLTRPPGPLRESVEGVG